jgi:hypothetical protein
MKYSKMKVIRRYSEGVVSYATGELVPNADYYVDRISNGNIIDNAPIFDYFYLKGYGQKKEWEWKLQDVHIGGWMYPRYADWYISDIFKVLLERFKIAPKYYFYESRLLYKGEKLKYWIFQFPIDFFLHIDYKKSEFVFSNEIETMYSFKNREEYLEFRRAEYQKTKKELNPHKIVFNSVFDMIAYNADKLVSERLKNAIEENGIEGFEFSELDYEVTVEK